MRVSRGKAFDLFFGFDKGPFAVLEAFQQRVRGSDKRQARLLKFFDLLLLEAKRFPELPVFAVGFIAGGLRLGDPSLGGVVLRTMRKQTLPRIGKHLFRCYGA